MTNDNLKARIRAHMAEHGVNYTTARRALLADVGPTATATAGWTYTPRVFTDPKVLTAVRRAYRKPHIKPYFQDLTEWTDTSGGEPWEPDTLREFPFLRAIEKATNTGDRPALRYCDPYDIMSDTIREAYLDDAEWEAERGTPLPDRHTREGWSARISHVPTSVDDPIYAAGEKFQYGTLSIADYETTLNAHLKKWPGSVHAWESLGGLHWLIAEEDARWSIPFPDDMKNEAAAEALRCYASGVAVAQRALPKDTNAITMWGELNNRPFLRCLHGLTLCHYRAGNTTEAIAVATDNLWLNPNDNQGIRYILADLLDGVDWEDAKERDY